MADVDWPPLSKLWVMVLTSLAAGAPLAADWPQYRGPDRNGRIAEDGLLETWSTGQPTVLWRRAIGGGYSAVSAVGESLYTMEADGEQEFVLGLDAETGRTIWRFAASPFVEAELGDSGPRSTPTVAGSTVFAVSFSARLMALAAADGRLLWERDLTELGPVPRFGYAVSPLVDGEVVIVEVGQKERRPGVAAFDRSTGERRWSALVGPAGYASPIVAEIAAVRQYVLFRTAGKEVVGLSTSGEILWRHPTGEALSVIPTPLFQPPDRIFVSTSEDAFGGHMLRIHLDADGFHAEEIWSERLMRNHFNSSVLVDGHLYGFDNGTLRCLDAATGAQRWAKRGFGKGSLIAAQDVLYVLSDDGIVALVHASPAGYAEGGRIRVMEGRSWTEPSLANGRLYLRDFDEIVSLDVRGDASAPGREVIP